MSTEIKAVDLIQGVLALHWPTPVTLKKVTRFGSDFYTGSGCSCGHEADSPAEMRSHLAAEIEIEKVLHG